MIKFIIRCSFFTLFVFWPGIAEPIVCSGRALAPLLGKPIISLRLVNGLGAAIPFQIDEVDSMGDYICPSGKAPNSACGTGLLKARDEMVFLWEDMDSSGRTLQPTMFSIPIQVRHGSSTRTIFCISDSLRPRSPVSYINYDSLKELVVTPFYYAYFGQDRFHFIRAGCMDFSQRRFIDLTHQLRIRLSMRALWGILPITYTEDNLVCLVKRYKAGPIRLIKRGDFYLDLGWWLKTSQAAVNQICYPQMTGVPAAISLPIRFKLLFKEVYLEMASVVTSQAKTFRYKIPSRALEFSFGDKTVLDTFIRANPDNSLMLCVNRNCGYGWLLQTSMPQNLLGESGYCFNRTPRDTALGYCGFKLSLRDLPAGKYTISNWVFFCDGDPSELPAINTQLLNPAAIVINDKSFVNLLNGASKPAKPE